MLRELWGKAVAWVQTIALIAWYGMDEAERMLERGLAEQKQIYENLKRMRARHER